MRSWFLLFGVLAACRAPEGPILVAAAADLESSLPRIAERYLATGAPAPSLSFGSSGLYAKQLQEGAPFDLYLSASGAFVDQVLKSGRCDLQTRKVYAYGRLALVTAQGVAPATALVDLSAPRFQRIALANPEHAPYGQAAMEVLKSAGLAEALEPRLVQGENVRQALTYVETGNADAALVAWPLVQKRPGAVLLDPALHRPLEQVLVVCATPTRAAAAQRFADFVTGPTGRALLGELGFDAHGQETATP